MPADSRPLAKLFPIELPPARIAVGQFREPLELVGVCVRFREPHQILLNEFLDARPSASACRRARETTSIIDLNRELHPPP
jgi:hypothetical protein